MDYQGKDFWENQYKRDIEKLMPSLVELGIADGTEGKTVFVNLRSQFEDVWSEVCYLSTEQKSFSCYRWDKSKQRMSKDFCRLADVRKFVAVLPENTRVLTTKDTFFSERTGNLNEIPKELFS